MCTTDYESKSLMSKIVICYLRADSQLLDDHILNRLASFFAPQYAQDKAHEKPVVHVELFFPDRAHAEKGVSSGIHYGGSAFMHPKAFSRKHWVFHSINATPDQVRRAKEFCRIQQGASFNYRGFFSPAFMNIGHATRIKGLKSNKRMPWYCSELTSYALYHAGILDDAQSIAARAHPHAAYHVIQECCDTYMDTARALNNKPLQL